MNKRIIGAHYNQVKHELLEPIATQKEPDPKSEILAYFGQDSESPEGKRVRKGGGRDGQGRRPAL